MPLVKNLTLGHLFVSTAKKYSTLGRFKFVNMTWDQEFSMPAPQLVTPFGAGFSFNIAPCDEIVYVDR